MAFFKSNNSQTAKEAGRKFFNKRLLASGIYCFLILGSYTFFILGSFGKYYYPEDIITDQQGNVYVTDPGIPGVYKFDSQGDKQLTIGSDGSADGQFQRIFGPNQTTVDNTGFIYVLERSRNKVQKFDAQGKFVQSWAVPEDTKYVLAGSANELYLGFAKEPYLLKTDSAGKIDENWKLQLETPAKGIDAAIVNRQGALYIRIGKTVSQISPAGTILNSITLENFAQKNYESFQVDAQGNFFVSGNEQAQKFDSQGKLLGTWDIYETDSKSWRRNATIDGSGNIYTSSSESGYITIKKFSPEGKAVKEWSYGWSDWFKYGGYIASLIIISILGVFLRGWSATPKSVVVGQPLPASVEQYIDSPHLLRDSLDLKTLNNQPRPSNISNSGALAVLLFSIGSLIAILIFVALFAMQQPNWLLIGLGAIALVPIFWGVVVITLKEKKKIDNRKAELNSLVRQVMGTLPDANRSLFINSDSIATGQNSTATILFSWLFIGLFGFGLLVFLTTATGFTRNWPVWFSHSMLAGIFSGGVLGMLWLNNALRPAKPHVIKLTRPEFRALAKRAGVWFAGFVLLTIVFDILGTLANIRNVSTLFSIISVVVIVVGYIYLLSGFLIVPDKWFYQALNAGDYEQALRRASYLRSLSNTNTACQMQFITLQQAGRFAEAEYLVQEALAKISDPYAQQLELSAPLTWLGCLRLNQERYAEALFLLENAIKCNPTARRNLTNLAEVYLWANANPYRAQELLDKARKDDSNLFLVGLLQPSIWGNYHINRGWALARSGQPADNEIALAFKKTDKKCRPGLASMHNRAAKIMLERGESGRAIEHLVQAELIDPQGFHGQRAGQNRQLLTSSPSSQHELI